jgi:acyl-CoA thioesterase
MTAMPHRDALQLAKAVGAKMVELDRASLALGMKLEDVGVGYGKMSMTIRPDMLNGHGTCHGGFIFTLADSAFAYACNTHNQVAVAAGCNIEYLRPVNEGDVLTATAHQIALVGRNGISDIVVTNQHGEIVATFRGKSVRIKGHIVE